MKRTGLPAIDRLIDTLEADIEADQPLLEEARQNIDGLQKIKEQIKAPKVEQG